MGAFVSEITEKGTAGQQGLMGCSQSKLVEYYSSYKSICEGYTINIAQFTHIFGANQRSFAVWDTKSRGRVDAIEFFSGLVVFSNIRYEQKVKFLFEIFDFNEQGVLGYENLALMLLNICNATYKLQGQNKMLSQVAVELFLDEYFTQESRIQLSRLLRWTFRVPLIAQFFHAIGHDIETPQQQRKIASYDELSYQQRQKKVKGTYKAERQLPLDNKFITSLDSLVNRSKIQQLQMLNLEINWVLGMEVEKQRVRYMRVEGQKAGNERILYAVGKTIVIYYPKLSLQHYYCHHIKPISVIQLSTSKKLVASAERGDYPQVHIWDVKTRLTLLKFRRLHKSTIELMSFINGDRILVTVSRYCIRNNKQCPVIVINLQTQEVIMSTYLRSEVLGIIPTNDADGRRLLSFNLLSTHALTRFLPQHGSFSLSTERLTIDNNLLPPINCFLSTSQGMLITSHIGRKLVVWNQKGREVGYAAKGGEIIQMVQLSNRLTEMKLLLLDESDAHIITLRTNDLQVLRSQQLQLRSGGLFNLRFSLVCPIDEDSILVASEFGDMVRVEGLRLSQSEPIRLSRYYQLFRLEQVYDCCFLNHESMLIFSGMFVYLIDRNQKQLKILSRLEFQVKQIDLYKETLVILGGEAGKNIIALMNPADFTIRESFKLACQVEDFKLTQNYLVVLSEHALDIFHRVGDRFFEREPVHHKLNVTKPVCLVRTQQGRSVLLITQGKQIMKVNLGGSNLVEIAKIQKSNEPQLDKFIGIYPEGSYRYPFAVNSNRRLVAMGRKDGSVQIWQSLIQAVGQNQSQTELKLHDDRVSRILLEDDQVVTVGGQDGLVVIYQHKKYLEIEEEEPFYEDQEEQEQKKHMITRSQWSSRKEVLSVSELLGNYLKQSQLNLSTLPDPQNTDIKHIINDIVSPRNRVAYEPLVRQQNNNYYENLHIQTEAILGMNSKSSRSLFYLHLYPNQSKGSNIDANYWQSEQTQLPPSSQELQFAKTSLLPLDDQHTNCKREVLSFSDRFCILKETGTQKQRFYEYHRRKITCIAVHPSRQLVCSCEIGHRSPLIHIWEPQQLITKATVQTRHNSAITRVQFSRDGEWIVSLGGSDREQSIQISSWKHQQIIAFRFLEEEILRQVLFDPYNREELCVAGTGLIRVYNIKNSQLIIKEECRPKQQQFQALTYTSSVFGSQIQSDVITGSNNGDIGLYICGKFIVSREKAHQGGVKCLRLAELFRYKRVLLSGGGEGVIKIWDVKFNQISKKNLRQQLYAARMTPLQVPTCAVTSLDVYQCLRQVGSQHPPTLLLIGTADGSVLEARIHNEFQGYQSYSIATAESSPVKQKINFDMTLLSTAPPTLITHFQLHLPLLATYSQVSPFLHIWAFATRTRLRAAPLPAPPAFVRFFNTKDRLLVGFKDRMIGALNFYLFTSGPTSVSELQLCGQIALQKGSYSPQTAVFSQKDNRLAVGFRSIDGDEIGIYDREEGDRQVWTMKIRVNQSDGKLKKLFWMEFSSSSLAILVGWNLHSKLDSNQENSNIYRCYSCSTQQILPSQGFDFQTLNFSPRILASYIPCLPLLDLVHKQSLLKEKLPITAMTQLDRYLLLGTVNGQVLVVQSDFFAKKDSLQTRVWTHIIGDAPITSLATIDGLLLATTVESEGITILKLTLERSWEPAQSDKDIYSQQLTQQTIEAKRSVYMQRKKIEGEEENGGQWVCQVELKLSAVIGRSALYRRSNLFIDLKDNIISFSGCNLLIMHYIEGQRISQQILKPDPSPASIHPEISCLALGDCKRLFLVGTNQDDARLIAWDISTNTNLFEIRFPGFISVAIAKLSPSNRHAALLAIAKTSQKYLIFVDLHNRKILAVHRFPATLQINDLCFVVGKQFWLIVCGGNYIAQWSYQNGKLSERRYSLKAEQSEENKFGIVFYSIIFVSEWAISAGSDGYLYVWTEGSIVKRQNAHPKEAVLCLYTSTGSKIFVSGATDGRVIIWHFGSSLIIQKIQQFATYTGKDPRAPLKFQVQSICMTKKSLIVGNRAGQIIQFPFSSGQTQSQDTSAQQPLTILSAFDHQKVNSCAFNLSSRKLYLMTEAEAGFGTFAVFDVATLQKMRQQRVQLKSGLVRMLACKLSSRIFVVMKNSIATYSYQAEVRDQKYNKFLRRKEWLKCESGIKAAVLNTSETYLAVLIAPNSLENAKIEIYNLEVSEGQFYSIYKVEENISANIELIDFSADHDYLVFQSTDEEMTILDLLSKEKVKPGSIENQLEWNEDAKKISSTVRNIAAAYSEDNKLLKVVQVRNQCLIATDTMGSLRLFPYPLEAIKDHPSRAYVQHLNQVYICVLSPDSRTLVTVGREDRAIHFWEVFHKPSHPNSFI